MIRGLKDEIEVLERHSISNEIAKTFEAQGIDWKNEPECKAYFDEQRSKEDKGIQERKAKIETLRGVE